jgi:hypothetical protein
LACFAVWEDGRISLRSTVYEAGTTIAKVGNMPIRQTVKEDLVELLRTGSLPEQRTGNMHMASLQK